MKVFAQEKQKRQVVETQEKKWEKLRQQDTKQNLEMSHAPNRQHKMARVLSTQTLLGGNTWQAPIVQPPLTLQEMQTSIALQDKGLPDPKYLVDAQNRKNEKMQNMDFFAALPDKMYQAPEHPGQSWRQYFSPVWTLLHLNPEDIEKVSTFYERDSLPELQTAVGGF